MKKIVLDVIGSKAESQVAENDVGTQLVITNTPVEWESCSVFAIFKQSGQTKHVLVYTPNNPNWETDVPSEFTDANKAFKIGVYAVGAGVWRDVRPSVWIRVMKTDFNTEDLIVTEQTIDDILLLQALYTEYEKAESKRVANENERIENENERKADISTIKSDVSALKRDVSGKVDKEEGKQLSTNDYTDSDAMKLSGIEDEAQKNVQSDWNISDTKSDAYIKNKPTVDMSYKSNSKNAQSGTAVAEAIAQLVGTAPDSLDTIHELAEAFQENADVVSVLTDAIGSKVDKETGKGLSSNDFDNTFKAKLNGIEQGAKNNVFESTAHLTITDGIYSISDLSHSYSEIRSAYEAGKICCINTNFCILYLTQVNESEVIFVGRRRVGNTSSSYIMLFLSESGESISSHTLYDSGESTIFKVNAITKSHRQNTMNYPSVKAVYDFVRPIPADLIPDEFEPNIQYMFGKVTEGFEIKFPLTAAMGDVMYINFETLDNEITVYIDTTNTTDIDITIEPNSGYEIYGMYNGDRWILGYSEYAVTDGESV